MQLPVRVQDVFIHKHIGCDVEKDHGRRGNGRAEAAIVLSTSVDKAVNNYKLLIL
jgi:hypothetical protein